MIKSLRTSYISPFYIFSFTGLTIKGWEEKKVDTRKRGILSKCRLKGRDWGSKKPRGHHEPSIFLWNAIVLFTNLISILTDNESSHEQIQLNLRVKVREKDN